MDDSFVSRPAKLLEIAEAKLAYYQRLYENASRSPTASTSYMAYDETSVGDSFPPSLSGVASNMEKLNFEQLLQQERSLRSQTPSETENAAGNGEHYQQLAEESVARLARQTETMRRLERERWDAMEQLTGLAANNLMFERERGEVHQLRHELESARHNLTAAGGGAVLGIEEIGKLKAHLALFENALPDIERSLRTRGLYQYGASIEVLNGSELGSLGPAAHEHGPAAEPAISYLVGLKEQVQKSFDSLTQEPAEADSGSAGSIGSSSMLQQLREQSMHLLRIIQHVSGDAEASAARVLTCEGRITQLTEEADRMKAQLRRLKGEASEVTLLQQRLHVTTKDGEAFKAHVQDSVKALQGQLEDMRRENTDLKNQLSSMKTGEMKMSAQRMNETRRIAESEAELSAAKEKATGSVKHAKLLAKRCEELQRALIEQVKSGRTITDSLKVAEDAAATSASKLEGVYEEMKELKRKLRSATEARKNAEKRHKDEIDDLSLDVETQMRVVMEAYSAELNALKEQLERMNSSHANTCSTSVQWQQLQDELYETRQGRQEEMLQHHNIVAELTRKLEKACWESEESLPHQAAIITSLREQVTIAQSQNRDLEAEMEDVKLESEGRTRSLNTALEAARLDRKEALEKLEQAVEKLEELKEELDQLHGRLEITSGQKAELEERLHAAEAEHSKQRHILYELEEGKVSYQHIQGQALELQTQLGSVQKQRAAVEKKLRDSEDQLRYASEEVMSLQQQLASSHSARAAAEHRFGELKEQVVAQLEDAEEARQKLVADGSSQLYEAAAEKERSRVADLTCADLRAHMVENIQQAEEEKAHLRSELEAEKQRAWDVEREIQVAAKESVLKEQKEVQTYRALCISLKERAHQSEQKVNTLTQQLAEVQHQQAAVNRLLQEIEWEAPTLEHAASTSQRLQRKSDDGVQRESTKSTRQQLFEAVMDAADRSRPEAKKQRQQWLENNIRQQLQRDVALKMQKNQEQHDVAGGGRSHELIRLAREQVVSMRRADVAVHDEAEMEDKGMLDSLGVAMGVASVLTNVNESYPYDHHSKAYDLDSSRNSSFHARSNPGLSMRHLDNDVEEYNAVKGLAQNQADASSSYSALYSEHQALQQKYVKQSVRQHALQQTLLELASGIQNATANAAAATSSIPDPRLTPHPNTLPAAYINGRTTPSGVGGERNSNAVHQDQPVNSPSLQRHRLHNDIDAQDSSSVSSHDRYAFQRLMDSEVDGRSATPQHRLGISHYREDRQWHQEWEEDLQGKVSHTQPQPTQQQLPDPRYRQDEVQRSHGRKEVSEEKEWNELERMHQRWHEQEERQQESIDHRARASHEVQQPREEWEELEERHQQWEEHEQVQRSVHKENGPGGQWVNLGEHEQQWHQQHHGEGRGGEDPAHLPITGSDEMQMQSGASFESDHEEDPVLFDSFKYWDKEALRAARGSGGAPPESESSHSSGPSVTYMDDDQDWVEPSRPILKAKAGALMYSTPHLFPGVKSHSQSEANTGSQGGPEDYPSQGESDQDNEVLADGSDADGESDNSEEDVGADEHNDQVPQLRYRTPTALQTAAADGAPVPAAILQMAAQYAGDEGLAHPSSAVPSAMRTRALDSGGLAPHDKVHMIKRVSGSGGRPSPSGQPEVRPRSSESMKSSLEAPVPDEVLKFARQHQGQEGQKRPGTASSSDKHLGGSVGLTSPRLAQPRNPSFQLGGFHPPNPAQSTISQRRQDNRRLSSSVVLANMDFCAASENSHPSPTGTLSPSLRSLRSSVQGVSPSESAPDIRAFDYASAWGESSQQHVGQIMDAGVQRAHAGGGRPEATWHAEHGNYHEGVEDGRYPSMAHGSMEGLPTGEPHGPHMMSD